MSYFYYFRIMIFYMVSEPNDIIPAHHIRFIIYRRKKHLPIMEIGIRHTSPNPLSQLKWLNTDKEVSTTGVLLPKIKNQIPKPRSRISKDQIPRKSNKKPDPFSSFAGWEMAFWIREQVGWPPPRYRRSEPVARHIMLPCFRMPTHQLDWKHGRRNHRQWKT